MDYDELFAEQEPMEVEDDNYSLIGKHGKPLHFVRKNNNTPLTNGMGFVSRAFYDETTKKNKYVDIVFHKTSFIPSSNIKNAITGQFYPYLVGSKEERQLFKVSLSTAEKGTFSNNKVEPCTLFYDSPGEYERHFGCDVNNSIKTKWLQNQRKTHAS